MPTMPDGQDDLAAEIAEELVRQIPVKDVYEDVASPAAKQAGALLEDAIKVLRLALFPLQYASALQDRYKAFLDKSIRRVPEDNRVPPAPQIIGPVLEGIRYEPEGTPIDEMFSQLLSRSMDRDKSNLAHPAFPLIVKQISSDEAKILKILSGAQYFIVYTSTFNPSTHLFSERNIETDELPKNDLIFPQDIPFYMDHLYQLGIAGIFQDGNQTAIYSEHGKQSGTRIISKYKLTEIGNRFVAACIGL